MKTLIDEKGKKFFLIPEKDFENCTSLEDFIDLQIAKYISKNGDFVDFDLNFRKLKKEEITSEIALEAEKARKKSKKDFVNI